MRYFGWYESGGAQDTPLRGCDGICSCPCQMQSVLSEKVPYIFMRGTNGSCLADVGGFAMIKTGANNPN